MLFEDACASVSQPVLQRAKWGTQPVRAVAAQSSGRQQSLQHHVLGSAGQEVTAIRLLVS